MKKGEARRFAQLFLHGPFKGKWAESARLAGIAEPDRSDPMLRLAFEELGEALPWHKPSNTKPEPTPAIITTTPSIPSLPTPAQLPPDDADESEWRKLADALRETIKLSALGEIKISAAQASLIKHILERAHGRVVDSQKSKAPVGVVMLPTVGSGVSAKLCPACVEAHKGHTHD